MSLSEFFDINLLNSLLRLIAPVLLAALGGLLCSHAGVLNIALEGFMLFGAFMAVWFSFMLNSAVGGVLAAVIATMFLALLFAILAINLKGNAIVLGIAFNLFCSGITVYLLTTVFNTRGSFVSPEIVGLQKYQIPVLKDIPFLGPLFSGHTFVVYLSLLILIIFTVFLYKHKIGLRLRGIGEYPTAAQSLGVNVKLYQFGAVILSGALCGLAGAQLSLGNVTLFVEGMSGGRGWIAVAAVMLSQGNPLSALLACLVFGFADAITGRLQIIGLPIELAQSLPYLVTVVSLVIMSFQKKQGLAVFENA